jgi:hypothetical protein
MADFPIQDEKLTALDGKVVIITGMKLPYDRRTSHFPQ